MIEVTTNKKRTVEVFSTVLFYEGDMKELGKKRYLIQSFNMYITGLTKN